MPALSDATIREMVQMNRLGIEPFDPNHIQPASYDLTLLGDDEVILVPLHWYLAQAVQELTNSLVYFAQTGYAQQKPNYESLRNEIARIHDTYSPQSAFSLLSTKEVITLPGDIKADVHGRSSLARKGLFIHVSAGFIDPGFSGQITLECINVSGEPITLLSGDRVAQICFYTLDGESKKPYDGRYQHQRGPTESRFQHGDN